MFGVKYVTAYSPSKQRDFAKVCLSRSINSAYVRDAAAGHGKNFRHIDFPRERLIVFDNATLQFNFQITGTSVLGTQKPNVKYYIFKRAPRGAASDKISLIHKQVSALLTL